MSTPVAKSAFASAALLASLAGWVPAAAALDDVAHYVFVPNRSSADVAIIDTREDQVVARVPVGNVPHQVAVSAELNRLVASNTADDTISIIDLGTLERVATVALDHEPEHIALNAAEDLAAIGNIGAGTVSFVSLRAARETARVSGLYEPHNMTFNLDGTLLYVANLGADVVSVVDVASGEVINEIQIGEPQTVAAASRADTYQGIIDVTSTRDGRLGFAAFGEGSALAVLDLGTQEVLKTLELGRLPWRAYPTADGSHMIIPNNGDATVSIVSTSSLEEVARLPGAADMTGVNSDAFGTTAFVISRGEDKLVVLDLVEMRSAGEIPLPSAPETGVTTPDGKKLYVALSGSDEVAVIDVGRREVIERIGDVGSEPWGAHMVGAINYCH